MSPIIFAGNLVLVATFASLAQGDVRGINARGGIFNHCFGELGCFSNFGWWAMRPVVRVVLPESPEKIATRFLVNSRAHPNPAKPEVLVYQSLCSSTPDTPNSFGNISKSFNPRLPTKILIHGFMANADAVNWVKMTTAFLTREDVNVVRVDWHKGNGFPYEQATQNTRVVGAQVAELILRLVKLFGMSPSQFHLVGHSLGAHTAGYAGGRVAGVARITGLDPAEPYFENFHTSVRLDPSDADFVDVIHTDGASVLNVLVGKSGFGMHQACGHVDFFPNGGADQPGCRRTQGKEDILRGDLGDLVEVAKSLGCSHERAILYFTESLSSTNCEFVAHQCKNYREFEQGRCSKCSEKAVCGVMGIEAEKLKGEKRLKMYLKTREKPAFCLKED